MKVLSLSLCTLLALGVSARADFDSCKARIKAEAASEGVSGATLSRALDDLEPNDAPSFLGVQPEFSTPIWDYIAGLVDEERVSEGRAAFAANRQAAVAAQQRFGVEAAAVVAVWGVESNFGKNFGARPVIQSLASLACLGSRRNDYFRSELIAALKIVDHGDVQLDEFTGSWAGAFGNTQFMPSTFLRLAVDMDGDGRRDVVGSVADALGSTANFLRSSGWVSGLPWGFEVALPENYHGPSGRSAKHPLASWAARGLTRIDGSALSGSGAFGLLLPAGPQGPAFLVSRNFDAFYAYNAAESYALAIALLSDRLKGKPGVRTPWPTDDPGLSRAERREVQARLEQRGFDVGGKHDGVMGTKTREAIKAYEDANGLKPDGRAGQKVLELLRAGR
ncbi:lytic murein transglycosylase [Rhodoblastus acidophilus]|uniref:Lytic murein transglycosylase n=1 Tax=Rhodoblastus acidophilus TaxID=1074 RepID=A0A212RMQ5_RHOAC|nr:lytic murein transglycosylase [Rhodoblastus acidophilus]MCW2315735.1 lytic murein transglycosylase [Rhodoblastus acidophilus]PPQ39176.1 lytic murein transglycosylase [Rhodoblastus acidophilus]RAI21064.1 lytic murein transglycosylase [Rhodoblastus acidophilus]SNB73746.1 lytic murein transglycosylase [Rhodoblastus acidophilus]